MIELKVSQQKIHDSTDGYEHCRETFDQELTVKHCRLLCFAKAGHCVQKECPVLISSVSLAVGTSRVFLAKRRSQAEAEAFEFPNID
jgi:hypothetical protein